MAGFLELLQIPFTGNPSRSLSLCQDKFCTKSVLAAHGLPVPQGWVVEKGDPIPTDLAFPLIVKPNEQDASLGIYPQSVVEDRASLAKRVEFVSERYGGPVLVESFIDGREFNVAVLDGRETRALPVSEIEFRDLPAGMPRILGYHAKWQEDHELYQRTVPVCPAAVSSETAGALQRTALAAYRALKLKGYARVDFRMDAAGKIHILEVNPNPDASRDSGIARALKAAGIKYEEFWDTQVLLALNSRGGLP
jgi:D-alanine-D-alanine ligase